MSDDEFISYCEAHCETERAGFVPQNIIRILALAGEDDLAEKWRDAPATMIVSIGPETMKPMCGKARANLQKPRP